MAFYNVNVLFYGAAAFAFLASIFFWAQQKRRREAAVAAVAAAAERRRNRGNLTKEFSSIL